MISYGVDLAHLVFSAVLVFFKLSWNLFFLQLPQFTFQIIQLSFKAHHSNRRKLRRAGCHKPSNFTFHHLDIFVSGCFFETSEELVSLSRINLIIDKLSAAHKLLKVSLLLERLRFKWFCQFTALFWWTRQILLKHDRIGYVNKCSLNVRWIIKWNQVLIIHTFTSLPLLLFSPIIPNCLPHDAKLRVSSWQRLSTIWFSVKQWVQRPLGSKLFGPRGFSLKFQGVTCIRLTNHVPIQDVVHRTLVQTGIASSWNIAVFF